MVFLYKKFLDEDGEENFTDCSVGNLEYFPVNIVQKPQSAKSKNGWLVIGGIQGESSDPFEAMDQAMSILQCRYAVV